VVTLISPDGTSGGPMRAALDQAKALQAAGHEVTVLGGWRQSSPLPTSIEGIPCVLFRVRQPFPGSNLRGLWSLRMLWTTPRALGHADILHAHACRDLVIMFALSCASVMQLPAVTQTHGMVIESTLGRF
jgi:Glycosyltransferase Family 4